MLRQDTARIDTDSTGSGPQVEPERNGSSTLDIQQELNRLEEIVLDSPRFLGRTLIDEDRLLEQLDVVRLNLPGAFEEVKEIIRSKEQIVLQAGQYAREIIDAAEERAEQILDEIGIVRQAKVEADRFRQDVLTECEEARDRTLTEIERLRRQAQQEIEEMRRTAFAECEAIEDGADDYADRVLENIETQLADMLRVIHNGRSQLEQNQNSKPTRQT